MTLLALSSAMLVSCGCNSVRAMLQQCHVVQHEKMRGEVNRPSCP
jgi:hypothetical protein